MVSPNATFFLMVTITQKACGAAAEEKNGADLSPALKLLKLPLPRWERTEVRVPNFITPHSNSLPQGERERTLELRSNDRMFCSIRIGKGVNQ
jgi:hypothetical protein